MSLAIHIVGLGAPPTPAAFAHQATAVAQLGGYLGPLAGDGELVVIDVRDPTRPMQVALHILPATVIATDLAMVAGHLLVADGRGRLMVLDVSDVRAPQVRANLDFGGAVTGLEARGERVWISWHDGRRPRVSLFDLRDPARPAELWSISTFELSFGLAPAQSHLVSLAAGALSVHALPTGLPTARATHTPAATPTFWAPTQTRTPTRMPTGTPTRVEPSPTATPNPRVTDAGRVWLPWTLAQIVGAAAD